MEPIIVEQTYNTPRHKVWNAITELDQMKQWFFNQIESFIPEVGFETQFNVQVEDRNYMHLWKLTEVVPNEKIIYNWRYEGIPGNSFVTFELSDLDGQTALKLTHTGNETFPRDSPEFTRESGIAGWTYFIKGQLKEYLDGHSE